MYGLMNLKSRYDYSCAKEAADYLKTHLIDYPVVAVLTGTGLGDCIGSMYVDKTLDYNEIPHFPVSTVDSHVGRLSIGRVADQNLMLMQGRWHLYEGYCSRQVTFFIRVMQQLGIKVLIMTNAAGGLNPLFAAGDIMVIEDHINLTGANPLIGSNDERWGPRFTDMTGAYSGRLQALAQAALEQDLKVRGQKGVYAGLTGPSLETPAEMRFLSTIGASAVGFSTVMETIAAVHAGIEVLGLSVITNICLPDKMAPANVEDIIAVAKGAAPHLDSIITYVIQCLSDA